MKRIRILLTTILTFTSAVHADERYDVEIFVGVGHDTFIEKVAVSDDGQFAVTAGQKTVIIWNYETGQRIQRIASAEDDEFHPTCSDLALAADNSRLVCRQNSVGYDSRAYRIRVADVASGAAYGETIVIPDKTNIRLADMISHDGRLITVDAGGKVLVFDTTAGKVIHELPVTGRVDQLSYSPDGNTLYLVLLQDKELGGLHAVDLATWEVSQPHTKQLRRVDRVALSGDGTKAMAVSQDRRYELFDLGTGERINRGKIRDKFIKRVRGLDEVWLSHDASVAITEFYDEPKHSLFKQYEYPTWNPYNNELLSLTAAEPGITNSNTHQAISISPDSRFVSFQGGVGNHESVNVYRVDSDDFKDVEFGKILKDFTFTPDGQVLGSVIARYKSAYLTERRVINTGEVAKRYTGLLMAPVGGVFILAGGNHAIVGNQLWDLRTGVLERTVSDIYHDPKWHRADVFETAPDRRHILTKSPNGSYVRLDLDSGTTTAVETPKLRQHELLQGFQYTPDGKQFAAATLYSNVTDPKSEIRSGLQFWDATTGQYTRRITFDANGVDGFDISADGKSVLVATFYQHLVRGSGKWDAHNELAIYDLASGTKQRVILENDSMGARYRSPRFLPDGELYVNGVIMDVQGNERLDLEMMAANDHHQVTIAPGGKTLVTHEFGFREGFTAAYFKRLIDIKTAEVLGRLGESASIARYSPDGDRIYTVGGTGQFLTYDGKTAELLATSYAFEDGEWVTVTPDGYYTASNGGSDYLNVRIGGETLPIDNFFDTYYQPAVVSAAMGASTTGERQEIQTATADIRENFQPPPQVSFTSPATNTKSGQPTATLHAEIFDRGGGIDEIRLYHNGKLIVGDSRGITVTSDNKTLTREFQVNLLPGENTFRLTAFSTGQRIESNPANLIISYDGMEATSDLFVLAVGINEYKNSSLNLNYGRPDAEAFVDAIRVSSQGIFNDIKVTAIYDRDATRPNLLAAFADIATQAGPEDAFLFFYAGHGVMSEPEDDKQADFYMALNNVVRLYGDNAGLAAGGVSAGEMTELTRKVQARKQMIVLDACQSGGAVQMFAMRGAAEQKAILQLARSAGLVVLASTGTEQYATEFQALGHGVFTYAFLQGLAGNADGGRKDGKITVKELEAFINDEVPFLTEKHRGQAQYPNSYARGQDFPLGIIN